MIRFWCCSQKGATIYFRTIKWKNIRNPRSWSHNNTVVFIFRYFRCLHLIYPRYYVHFMNISGTNIFGNLSSAANNNRTRLLSRLSFRFLWLYLNLLLQSCLYFVNWIIFGFNFLKVVFLTVTADLRESDRPVSNNIDREMLKSCLWRSNECRPGYLGCYSTLFPW